MKDPLPQTHREMSMPLLAEATLGVWDEGDSRELLRKEPTAARQKASKSRAAACHLCSMIWLFRQIAGPFVCVLIITALLFWSS